MRTVLRRTRLTLLLALLVVAAVLAWLYANPGIYAGHIGRMLARNLLQDTGVSFRSRSFDGDLLHGVTFHQLSLTRRGDDGSFVYLSADSLSLDYDPRPLLQRKWRIDHFSLHGAELLLRLPPPEGAGGAPPLRPSAGFEAPRLDVGDLWIDRLSFQLQTFSGAVLEEADSVEARLSVHPDGGGFGLPLQELRGNWRSRELAVQQASGQLHWGDGRLRADSTLVAFGRTRATVDGHFAGGPDIGLDVQAEHFVLQDLLKVLGPTTEVDLELAGTARVDVDSSGTRVRTRDLAGQVSGYPVRADDVELLLDGEGMEFIRYEGMFNRAMASVEQGRLRWDPPRLDLGGSARSVDLSQPWVEGAGDWPRTDLAGPFELGLDLAPPALDLQLLGLRGTVGPIPTDSLRGRVQVRPTGHTRFERVRGRMHGTGLQAHGHIDSAGVVDLAVLAEAPRLLPWAQELRWEGMGGFGATAAGQLRGPVEDPVLVAEGVVDSSWALTHVGARDLRFQVEVPVLRPDEGLALQLSGPRATLGGRPIGQLRVTLRQEGLRTVVPVATVTRGDSTLAWRGWAEPEGEAWRVHADSLALQGGVERWALAEPASVLVEGTRVSTRSLELRSDDGRLLLSGSFDPEGSFDLELAVRQGKLEFLHRSGLTPVELEGVVDGELSLAGSLRRPRGELRLRVDRLRAGGHPVDSLSVALALAGAQMQVDSLVAASPDGRGRASGELQWPQLDWLDVVLRDPARLPELWAGADLDTRVAVAQLRPAAFVPDPPEALRGELSFRGDVLGPSTSPRIRGELSWEGLMAGPLALPRLAGNVRADARGVSLSEAAFLAPSPWLMVEGQVPLVVSLAAAPRWQPENGVRLQLQTPGAVPLAPLAGSWAEFREVEGTATVDIRASGDPRAPRWQGTVALAEGRIAFTRLSEELRELSAHAQFDPERGVLAISDLRAREGLNGRIEGSGEIAFDGLLPDDLALDLRGSRVLVASVPELRAIGSSDDLRVRLVEPFPGAGRVPRVSGNVLVDKAIYTGDFSQAQPVPVGTPAWMADLQLRLRDQVRLSNASAELRVNGDVDFVRDLGGIRLRGEVEIPQGRVPLFANDFTITEGRIDFSRGRGIEPQVDITAETEVPIADPTGGPGRELELVRVHVTGSFAAPNLRFESESGLDENSILRLLAGFAPEEGAGVGSGLGDVGFKAGLNMLERALAREIQGVDTIDIETEEAGLQEVEGTRIAVGKYLSRNLYLRYSQGLSITERDLFLEYQMTRRLLFTSEVQRRLEETGARTGFTLDLKFRVKY